MSHRGAVLPAVLLIAMSLLFLAAGVIHMVRAETVSLGASESLEQSRLIMRSAVRAVGLRLAEQQQAMFAGLSPEVPSTLDLFETSTQEAIAVILPLGPRGELFVAEAGKLDLNTASAEMIAATGLFEVAEAEALIAARGARAGGRFERMDDLLSVDGVNIDETRLYGDLTALRVLSLVDGNEESLGERAIDRLERELGTASRSLLDVFTVHSFEPDVRVDGKARLGFASGNISEGDRFASTAVQTFIETVRETLGEREGLTDEGRELVPIVVEAFGGGTETTFVKDDLIAEAIDGLTLVEGGWRIGRIDINHAPLEVLRAIPGLSENVAESIASHQQALSEATRFDRLWPVREGLVGYEEYAEPFNSITTRSMLWRARIAAGFVPLEEPDASINAPLVWEVLYDCSQSPPRLVEITDVSMVELLGQLLALDKGNDEVAGEVFEDMADLVGKNEETSALFDEEPLFDEKALFEDFAIFDEEALFDEKPLFADEPPSPTMPISNEPTFDPVGRWSPTGKR